MKYFKLNKDEQEIVKDFEAGKLKRVTDTKKETSRYKGYVKASLNKTRNINIRLSNKALQKIKALAAEKGLPYQTFISSLLHQYSIGKIERVV